ncbi:MAG: MgtC/SapB family protein [Gammaproteobacteria bacterium]|jgi:uncharacterized membrane protein (DUF4010 family)
MNYDELIGLFGQFGLAVLVGALIGLEREMRAGGGSTLGLRDFVFFALIGAFSAFLAERYEEIWIVALGFASLLTLILSSYWADRKHGPGITTELAAVMTFFLGVLILFGAQELAIALAILTLGVLFPKVAIKQLARKVSPHELQAVLLFLIISFIVLPVLPNQTLDHLATFEVGSISGLDPGSQQVIIKPTGASPKPGTRLEVFEPGWRYLGMITLDETYAGQVTGHFEGERYDRLAAGQEVRSRLDLEMAYVVLAALNPHRIWLIVVLVSFVSFLGYVLIKALGSGAGIGLTGLLGGLVSSTATTLSFARRSLENASATPLFAVAIILASAVMFPRLILEIGIFNTELMKSIAVPLAAMGLTGVLLAAYAFRRFRAPQETAVPTVTFDNPFSLKSAISFALIFALILAVTRLATEYLGNAWLPLVALVSGLTDADAIAFSISNLHRNGLVSLEWASFNLVLGALSNTFMKLALVFTLASPALFRRLLWNFLGIGGVGILTMLLYYDLGTFN